MKKNSNPIRWSHDDMGTPIEDGPPWAYICSRCAEELKGEWPMGHVSTFHEGSCDRCSEVKPIARNYNWGLDTEGNLNR